MPAYDAIMLFPLGSNTNFFNLSLFPSLMICQPVKLNSQVKEIQKDLDNISKRDTYVETVKLRAEVDQIQSQVSSLWDYTNKLRDEFNGH